MIIRALVILLCLQSVLLFAQPGPGRHSVPPKSKDCTPAEEKWWNDIRKKGDEILDLRDKVTEARRRGGNSGKVSSQLEAHRKELIGLIKTGQDNNYNVPVDDTRITLLYTPRPDYTEEARQQRESGTVLFEAQFLPDGTTANARVLRGLKYGLNDKALEVANHIVFIPSVANGHFRAGKEKMVATFTLL